MNRKIYRRYSLDPNTAEVELLQRSGHPVKVLGLSRDYYEEHETGPMYEIEFADGFREVAFADELHDA